MVRIVILRKEWYYDRIEGWMYLNMFDAVLVMINIFELFALPASEPQGDHLWSDALDDIGRIIVPICSFSIIPRSYLGNLNQFFRPACGVFFEWKKHPHPHRSYLLITSFRSANVWEVPALVVFHHCWKSVQQGLHNYCCLYPSDCILTLLGPCPYFGDQHLLVHVFFPTRQLSTAATVSTQEGLHMLTPPTFTNHQSRNANATNDVRLYMGDQHQNATPIRVIKLVRIIRTLRIFKTVLWLKNIQTCPKDLQRMELTWMNFA